MSFVPEGQADFVPEGQADFVPEGQADSSQAQSAWIAMQRGCRPGATVEVIAVPQILAVETELRPTLAMRTVVGNESSR
jgi:hypothetical protein